MNKFKKAHIDEITEQDLKTWAKHRAFITFASCSGKKGHIELGVNGVGMYAVKENFAYGSNKYFFKNPEDAINAYSNLII